MINGKFEIPELEEVRRQASKLYQIVSELSDEDVQKFKLTRLTPEQCVQKATEVVKYGMRISIGGVNI